MDQERVFGRKIFFLYPPSVIQEEMAYDLLRRGYEVYLLRDHLKLIQLLREFPDSILFINIDKGLSEPEWEKLIGKIQNDPALKETQIGVLTYNVDPVLERRFTEILRLSYGYIRLKISHLESLNILLKIMETHNARGRRQHVRARCEGDLPVTFYVKIGSDNYSGRVLDISTVGMACVFDKPLNERHRLDEIHVNLHQVILRIAGHIQLVRGDRPPVSIILFEDDTSDVTKDKILSYVRYNLQHFIEHKLQTLPDFIKP